MQQFIQQVIKFSVLILVFFLLNVGINSILIKDFLNPDVVEATMIIAGDSHLVTSLNPEILDSSINISHTGEPYISTFYKLKEILKLNKPNLILTGFSFHNISTFNENKLKDPFWATIQIGRIYPVLPLNAAREYGLNYVEYGKTILKRMGLIPLIDHHQRYLGSFQKKEGALDSSNVEEIIKRHYGDSESNVSSKSIQYLDSIVNLCLSNEIKLILISTPVHPDYIEKVPKKVNEQFYTIAKELDSYSGVYWMNYLDLSFPEHSYQDHDHLNYNGSEIFSKIVDQDIKAKSII